MYTAQGRIATIKEVVERNAFKSQTFAVADAYSLGNNLFVFELRGHDVGMINRFKEGDYIEVDFLLAGREYEQKLYSSLVARDIRLVRPAYSDAPNTQSQPQQTYGSAPAPAPAPSAPRPAQQRQAPSAPQPQYTGYAAPVQDEEPPF